MERIGVASVYEEGEGEVFLGSWGVRGWNGGCEKVDGLDYESNIPSGVPTSELYKLEIVLKTVCVE